MRKVFGVLLIAGIVLALARQVLAMEPVEELQKQIDELNHLRELSAAATAPLEKELASIKSRLNGVAVQLKKAEDETVRLQESIVEREGELGERYKYLAVRVRSFYKLSRQFSPLLALLSSDSAAGLTKQLSYRSAAAGQDKEAIVTTTKDILKLEEDKLALDKRKVQLAGLRVEYEKNMAFFDKEIKGAKAYQAELSGKIASLTAKQQQIIAQKLGGLNLPQSLGAGPMYCTDDRNINPGFGSAFAFFTYGIPHRVGMNQYGAYGRANAGQSYEQILRAYFNFDEYRDSANVTIKVNNGNGIDLGSVIWTGSLEDYVKRIYEVPASWPIESLKAQAIAARSYAIAVTDNGNKSICANQHCQVFKTDPKGGAWDQAVTETSGKTMVQGGQVITAWYSSTDGGYTFNNNDVWGGAAKGWSKRTRDTNGDVGSFGDLQAKAYDKDSPCFYAAQGYRNEYGKSAWLKSEEVADIVNALMLAKQDSSAADHLYQTDKPHPYGGEVWSAQRVKDELRSKGITPYDSVSDVSVSADFGSGKSTSISVSGGAGTKSFSADEFKSYFNVRAPANIQIVGPLYNVERR